MFSDIYISIGALNVIHFKICFFVFASARLSEGG